jgi:hypothetical protein
MNLNSSGKRIVIVWVLAGLLLLWFMVEFGLNLWVRSALRHSLLRDSISGRVRIERFDWLSPGDLLGGRVKSIKLDCDDCNIGEINFDHLHVDSRGFRLDPVKLLLEKKLVLISLNPTSITARVTAIAATDFLFHRYASFKPEVEFFSDGLRVGGETEFWENRVPVLLSGRLAVNSPKTIRFFPEKLSISGRQAPRDFLRFLGGQIPLEIPVLHDWPLQISDLKLEPGILIVTMREME